MKLVYSFRIDCADSIYPHLKLLSRVSKDLYNQALFEVKAHYEETGEILSYLKLEKRMKTKSNLEGNINYRLLPAQVSQQTLRLLCVNIKAYFSAKKDYAKHPEKYCTPPKFPSFLPKDGHFVLVFTNQKASIKSDGTLKLTKEMSISIPEKEIEIIYEKEQLNPKVSKKRVASLDLGVNNLITLVDNFMGEENREPIIINGRPIKSINQFYNKKRALLQTRLSTFGKKTSREVIKLTDWRNQKIADYMHKASRFVIRHCLDNKIGHIVIGKNDTWKQSINLGKLNNQNFVSIPFNKLIQQIQYKAKLVGILVTTEEESYTSKCSALDLETIGKHEDHTYAGKRIKRGLFSTSLGLLINADVNGALNILRIVIGDNFLKPFIEKVAWLIPSRGYLCYPIKVCF